MTNISIMILISQFKIVERKIGSILLDFTFLSLLTELKVLIHYNELNLSSMLISTVIFPG